MGKSTGSSGKPPSRKRYEANNPTVSARLPKDKRVKLRLVLQRLNLSLSNLLIKTADDVEIKLKPLEEARQDSYREGYEIAKSKFEVTYPCPKCGSPVTITSQVSKSLVSKYLKQCGPGHEKCPKKGGQ